jgi:hypothetical protein
MALDSEAARVIAALHAGGVDSILLRGPAIAAFLYTDGTFRPYSDIDVLTSPEHRERAEHALAELGYTPYSLGAPAQHAQTWEIAGRRLYVDLHRSLVGIDADEETAWRALSAGTEEIVVARTPVTVLGAPQQALVVALHAAQHGAQVANPAQDIARAVVQVPDSTWADAADLASRVDATPAFGAGLRSAPGGAELATRLGLPTRTTVDTELRASTAPDLTLALERLATMGGLRGRSRFVLAKLFPAPAFMRASSPVARRGLAGLVVAYLWRPLWMLSRAPQAVLAWRRARRASR